MPEFTDKPMPRTVELFHRMCRDCKVLSREILAVNCAEHGIDSLGDDYDGM